MSKIEWTDETWNPVVGCRWASPGCDNCYAASMTRRLESMGHKNYAGLTTKKRFNGKIRTLPEKLDQPLRWKKPRMVFVNSMSDLFHPDVPFEFVDKVFAVMALCPQHTFQCLTKRPERMAEYLSGPLILETREEVVADQAIHSSRHYQMHDGRGVVWDCRGSDYWRYQKCSAKDVENRRAFRWPLPNVWLGTSVEDQERADERREHLRNTPAAVRFVSYEPALGPVDWSGWEFVDQIISGGESGPGSRPSHPSCHRNTRDFCVEHGIAFFFKQWGEWAPYTGRGIPPNSVRYMYPGGRVSDHYTAAEHARKQLHGCVSMHRVGKKAAGRLLDGREWSEFPERGCRRSAEL